MARWKLWVVVVLALGAGAASLAVGSADWAARQLEQVDRNLAASRAQIELSQAMLGRQVEAVALLAARDPALLEALAEPAKPARGKRKASRPAPKAAPRPDPSGVADAAVKAAAQALRLDLSRGLVSSLVTEGGPGEGVAPVLVEAALGGEARQGHVRHKDKVYAAAAVPVRKGMALLFGVPVDPHWKGTLQGTTPVRVVLFSGPGKPGTPLPAGEEKAFAAAAGKPGGAPVSLGRLGKVKAPGLGFLPPLPLLFVQAPAQRLQGVALAGLPGAALVLAAPTGPALAPVGAWQQITVAALALVLLVALAITVFSGGGAGRWPGELLAAADRIADGDFAARVPRLAGQAGRLGAALNRAAEAAAGGPGAPEAVPEAYSPEAVPEAAPEAVPEAAPEMAAEPREAQAELAPEPAAAPPPELEAEPATAAPGAPILAMATTGQLDGSELFAQASAPAARSARFTSTATFEAPAPAAPPAPAAGASPAAPDADEEHWQQVFQDFLGVREQCGEPSEGLTYERFRQKLQKNKEGLIAKYSCRGVRFQVYVRDGKAALKATPVR